MNNKPLFCLNMKWQSLVLSALLCGCQISTDIPEVTASAPQKTTWRGGDMVVASAVIDPQWWTQFEDPTLDKLIDRGLSSNLDLGVALGRLGEARASVSQVESRLLPTIGAEISTPIRTQRNPFTGEFETTRNYSAQTSLNWELDLWGKLQKGVEASESAYQASEAEWRATYLNTVAQVAVTYFLIRQLDDQMLIQQSAIDENQLRLEIYEAQYEEGLISSREILRQQAEQNSLNRSLIDLRRERELAVNALATLIGQPAGEFDLPAERSHPRLDIPIPGGLPADLLKRRPDILAAEYRVLEAYQLLGQARLAQLPGISLTASAGGGGDLVSATLNSLVNSMTYGLTPSLSIPIFDPETKARIRRSDARTDTVEAEYRRTVLVAFQEVEDNLVNLSARREQRLELQAELQSLQQVDQQINQQLAEGMVTQLDVFESQRRLLGVEQSLLNNRQQILSDTVTLYKAMGGGWPSEVLP